MNFHRSFSRLYMARPGSPAAVAVIVPEPRDSCQLFCGQATQAAGARPRVAVERIRRLNPA